MTSCSASSASAFPEAPPSPSVAIAATRSITPAPVRPWQGSGPLDAKTASRFSIGQRGRSDGPLLGPSGAPFYPSTRPSTSSRTRISSGRCANLPSIKKAESRAEPSGLWKESERRRRLVAVGECGTVLRLGNPDPRNLQLHRLLAPPQIFRSGELVADLPNDCLGKRTLIAISCKHSVDLE